MGPTKKVIIPGSGPGASISPTKFVFRDPSGKTVNGSVVMRSDGPGGNNIVIKHPEAGRRPADPTHARDCDSEGRSQGQNVLLADAAGGCRQEQISNDKLLIFSLFHIYTHLLERGNYSNSGILFPVPLSKVILLERGS